MVLSTSLSRFSNVEKRNGRSVRVNCNRTRYDIFSLFWNEEGVAIGDYDSFFIGDEEYSTSSIIGFKEWFLQVDKYDPYTDIAQFMTEGMEEWVNLEYEFAKQIRSMIPKEVGLYYKFLLEIIVFRLLLSLASSI